jgi:hypothetical protein
MFGDFTKLLSENDQDELPLFSFLFLILLPNSIEDIE